jgi:hypothetical protein
LCISVNSQNAQVQNIFEILRHPHDCPRKKSKMFRTCAFR